MNNVEKDLPLSEWAGQLAGAVSGVFLRKFPLLEMPSEEVAAIVDQFFAAPPADVPLNWTATELLEVDQATWWEPDHVTALRLSIELTIGLVSDGRDQSPVRHSIESADKFLDWLRKNQPE